MPKTQTNRDQTVFGPPISPLATSAEREAYRRDVLKLPGPIDQWLLVNSRTPCINFLQPYLMLDHAEMQTEYVTCSVELVIREVCFFVIQLI